MKHQAVEKNTKLRYQEMIRNNLTILEEDEFKDVLAEYDNLQAKDKRGHIRKWHSLSGGPEPINPLAEHFKENHNDSEKGVVTELYSFLSIGAHNYLAIRDVFIADLGNVILRDTRYLTDPNSNEYNLDTVRVILTYSIIKFTYNEYYKTEEFGDFVNALKKHTVNENMISGMHSGIAKLILSN